MEQGCEYRAPLGIFEIIMKKVLAAFLLLGCTQRTVNVANVPMRTSIVEDSVTLATPNATIYGTLELPAGADPSPVVLIVAGSGPTDRNGNSRVLPGANNALKMLADGLAARGIASLRYDKRGIGQSITPAMKEDELRFTNYVDDASAWIRQLRADRRFSTITVAGHSEGSLIGMIAARDASADAFISLEGAGRNAMEVVQEQLAAQLAPDVVANARRLMDKVAAGEKVDSVPPFLAALFRPSVQPYLTSWFKYTPADEIVKLKVPVMIIQGTTDIQTSMEDSRRLAAALKSAKVLEIEGMNHVLKNAPAGRAEQMPAYTDPNIPVVPRLLDEMAAFVKSVKKH
jgi:pimeloyl-ACP methyl ester carboxylesterase